MVSDIRVTAITADEGEIDLTPIVRQVSVSDSMNEGPRASLVLPLFHDTASKRVRNTNRFNWGDQIRIDMIGWTGNRSESDWETVLDGILEQPTESQAMGSGFDVACNLEARSFAGLLEEDTLAWWLYAGTIEGWNAVLARLSPDQLNNRPSRVAFEYIRKVGLYYANYDHLSTKLEDVISMASDGIPASAPLQFSLQLAEGPHLQLVRGLTDAPLHEVYVTTMREKAIQGTNADRRKYAAKPRGEGRASTTITFRAAPYPFVTERGLGNTGEWQRLTMHDLSAGSIVPVDTYRAGKNNPPRNFFMTYPGFQLMEDVDLFALGAAVQHKASIKRHGHRPMKTRTKLVWNNGLSTSNLKEFISGLNYRLAGQWNRAWEWWSGSVNVPLAPSIRPGERVKIYSPWHGGDLYQFHVQGRSMSWNPESGGSMTLNLERGLPDTVYNTPSWFADGLELVRIGADVYANNFREQDDPSK